jgi:hypothetical protein
VNATLSLATYFEVSTTFLIANTHYFTSNPITGTSKVESTSGSVDTQLLFPRWVFMLPDGGLELVL